MEFADVKLIIEDKEIIERLNKLEKQLKGKNNWKKADILQFSMNAFQDKYMNVILTYLEFMIDEL